MPKKLITEWAIVEASRRGEKAVAVDKETLVTVAAQDRARQLGVRLERVSSESQTHAPVANPLPTRPEGSKGTIAIGSDHGGFQLKESLKPFIESEGFKVIDVGTASEEACDYPDYAYAVVRMVQEGRAAKGIMIDAIGSASAIVANKVPGIRAVCCFNEFSARSSREHNDANVLTLGGRILGPELAKSILKIWLDTPFAGGRHQKRIEKISDVERRFMK